MGVLHRLEELLARPLDNGLLIAVDEATGYDVGLADGSAGSAVHSEHRDYKRFLANRRVPRAIVFGWDASRYHKSASKPLFHHDLTRLKAAELASGARQSAN